jgi:triosephosphate isomerase (TIM)
MTITRRFYFNTVALARSLLIVFLLGSTVLAAPKFVGANWKCQLESLAEVDALVDQVNQKFRNSLTRKQQDSLELCLLVPYVYIDRVRQRLDRRIRVGSQSVGEAAPFRANDAPQYKTTGTVTARMLHSVGCDYVLLGHSDRRNALHERDAWIAAKVAGVLQQPGLGVVWTLGELPWQRRWGRIDAVLRRQLRVATRQMAPEAWSRLVIAYEPVWAIGPGAQPCAPEEAQRILLLLRGYVRQWFGPVAASRCRYTYTGSVDAENCAKYAAYVDGFVVGRAGLNATQLETILRSFG